MSANNKSTPSESFVNDSYDLSGKALKVARRLLQLSKSFEETGNFIASQKILEFSADIIAIAEGIQELCSAKVDSDYNRTIEDLASVLKAFGGHGADFGKPIDKS